MKIVKFISFYLQTNTFEIRQVIIAQSENCVLIFFELTLFLLDTCKHLQVLWQTVKTQMKCSIRRHCIKVCNVCLNKNNLQGQTYTI